MLEVYLPYPKALITQKFGANANPLYAKDGLKGHSSYDWGASYGTPIPNCVPNAYCYSVMHKNDPDLGDYRAVFTIAKDELGNYYEVSYGHCSEITAEVGKTYQVGDIIAKVGNTGPVYSGSHEVTEKEKEAGSHAGAHLHGPQIRPVKRVRTPTNKQYLSDEKGIYKDFERYMYEVIDYNNGYNGCINFAPFSTEIVATDYKNLQVASAVVPELQKTISQIATVPVADRKPFITAFQAILDTIKRLFITHY